MFTYLVDWLAESPLLLLLLGDAVPPEPRGGTGEEEEEEVGGGRREGGGGGEAGWDTRYMAPGIVSIVSDLNLRPRLLVGGDDR